jgi:hypothetical protein
MLKRWPISFPNTEPIAYALKTAFPMRWVRFHSLPDSKRYPESEEEFRIVIERHNAVLASLTGSSSRVALLTTFCTWEATPPQRSDSSSAVYWRTVPMEESYWHLFAEECVWRSGLFDALVRRVAMDEVANILICDLSCDWVLHPYDGGMDVILPSAASRDLLKAQFRDWQSSRPDGL